MCEFMSLRWHRALSKYDYAMRVDEDVCLQDVGALEGAPIEPALPKDPFALLRSKGLVYAYGVELDEQHEETVETMVPWANAYRSKLGLGASHEVRVSRLRSSIIRMNVATRATPADGHTRDPG